MNVRLRQVVLVSAGLAFALFPILRPWADKEGTPAGMVAAFGSPWWVGAHLLGAAGFVLLSSVVAANWVATGWFRVSAWTASVGTALALLYFGAESFGLHGVAQAVEASRVPAVADAVRNGPAALLVFGVGLLSLAVAGVALAVGQWRSGWRQWGGVVLAAGLASYLPQFFLPAEGRIAHGMLMLAGTALWAACLGEREPGSRVQSDQIAPGRPEAARSQVASGAIR